MAIGDYDSLAGVIDHLEELAVADPEGVFDRALYERRQEVSPARNEIDRVVAAYRSERRVAAPEDTLLGARLMFFEHEVCMAGHDPGRDREKTRTIVRDILKVIARHRG